MNGILLKVTLVVTLVFNFGAIAYADCPDSILNPGHDIKVKYHNNKYDAWALKCKKSGHDKHWSPPHRAGKGCADSRKNGCSMKKWGIDFKNAFSKRDKDLITPSCNLHDLCYNTKGPSRKTCDDELKKNLLATYKRWDGAYSTNTVYEAVRKYGQSSYTKGQKWGKVNQCKY